MAIPQNNPQRQTSPKIRLKGKKPPKNRNPPELEKTRLSSKKTAQLGVKTAYVATLYKGVLFKCIETDTIEHKTQNQTGQNTTLNYLQPHIKIGKQNSG